MGVGGWHWNDAWIFVSAVIAERLDHGTAKKIFTAGRITEQQWRHLVG